MKIKIEPEYESKLKIRKLSIVVELEGINPFMTEAGLVSIFNGLRHERVNG